MTKDLQMRSSRIIPDKDGRDMERGRERFETGDEEAMRRRRQRLEGFLGHQECPVSLGSCKGRKDPSVEPPEGAQPCDTWISDFWLPKL